MGSSPKADPRIAEAALKSAAIGERHQAFMERQAEITNGWAQEDRARYQNVFQPLQDAYIREAQNYDTPERRAKASRGAMADVRLQSRIADGSRLRQSMAMGVSPNSGRYQSASAKAGLDGALASIGAGNMARDRIEAMGEQKRANAINMGSGLAVNPAQSIGLTNNAASSGASMAMQGQNQMGGMLNTLHQHKVSAYNARMGALGAIAGAGGMAAGMKWG